jgi:putative sigma-54 modulation protein
MQFNFTARHFKAPENLREFAQAEAEKLNKFYDGLIKCNVILSTEKPTSTIKTAEIIVTANSHHVFMGKVKTDDYRLSMERGFDKVKTQLKKFKEKLKSNHNPKNTKVVEISERL